MKRAPRLPADHLMVINLSGRGDKDIYTVAKALGAGSCERDAHRRAASPRSAARAAPGS